MKTIHWEVDLQGKSPLIQRSQDEERLLDALRRMPVVLLTGPRQAGKSTLARMVVDAEMTPSIRHAIDDLGVDRVLVVHAGDRSYPLDERVLAVNAERLLTEGFGTVI